VRWKDLRELLAPITALARVASGALETGCCKPIGGLPLRGK